MAFYIKQNDTSPSLQATLKDASGSAINLSGASVQIHMEAVDGTLKVNKTMTVTDQVNGIVEYDWVSGDTDTAGTYYVEFQVTYSDSTIETFPNNNKEVIIIRPELN
jgi:5-hydroxyisourate hydrolase-like protein (transthyretin family)